MVYCMAQNFTPLTAAAITKQQTHKTVQLLLLMCYLAGWQVSKIYNQLLQKYSAAIVTERPKIVCNSNSFSIGAYVHVIRVENT